MAVDSSLEGTTDASQAWQFPLVAPPLLVIRLATFGAGVTCATLAASSFACFILLTQHFPVLVA